MNKTSNFQCQLKHIFVLHLKKSNARRFLNCSALKWYETRRLKQSFMSNVVQNFGPFEKTASMPYLHDLSPVDPIEQLRNRCSKMPSKSHHMRHLQWHACRELGHVGDKRLLEHPKFYTRRYRNLKYKLLWRRFLDWHIFRRGGNFFHVRKNI